MKKSQRYSGTKFHKHNFKTVLKFLEKEKKNLAFMGGNSMVFMNNPVGLGTTGNTALVENKSLLSPNDIAGARYPYFPVIPSGFPEATLGCPVKPFTLQVLVIHRTEEKPFWVIGFDH